MTGLINNLVNLAVAERNHATDIFLQWFVTEEVEEDASTDKVVQRLKLMGDASDGLFMLDRGGSGSSRLLPLQLGVDGIKAPMRYYVRMIATVAGLIGPVVMGGCRFSHRNGAESRLVTAAGYLKRRKRS